MGVVFRTTGAMLGAAVLLLAGCRGSNGADGTNGVDGRDGANGRDAQPCSVTANTDGTKTITCPNSNPVTIANGTNGRDGTNGADGRDGANGVDGTSCTVANSGAGVKTISCTDGTSVTVSDGAPCTATDNGAGAKTITCPGSSPVTVRDGSSCTVVDAGGGTTILSCTDGTRGFIAPPFNVRLDTWEDLPGVVPAILAVGGASNSDGSFAPGDTLSVTFKVTTNNGRAIPLKEMDTAGIWVAGPNSNYQHILPSAADAVMLTNVVANARLNDDGSYTYTFASPIPATYGVPINNTAKFTTGELVGALDPGTYTVAMAFSKDYWTQGRPTPDANSVAYDFRLNIAALSAHEVVAVGNCNACHERFQMHGGQFRTPLLCATCHTAGAEDMGSSDVGDATPVTIDFSVMIHKLHNGVHLPSVQGVTTDPTGARVYGLGTPYVVGAKDYSRVTFPAFPNFNIQMPKNSGYSALASSDKTKDNNVRTGVTSCANCHGDPDGTGPLPAPAQGDSAYVATMRACGSCHDDLDYARPYTKNGQTMAAGIPESQCAVCHQDTGNSLAVKPAHLHPVLNPTVTPVNSINITSITGGTGPNGNFLAGDAPVVTFTAKDPLGADLPINSFDSFSLAFTGPTENRQVVIPGALTASPFDITGRLVAASTTNKGLMSKVYPDALAVSETLTVSFVSATSFNVTGSVRGALGAAALPGSPSTNPTGSSVSNIVLTPAAVAQNITVAFTGPTTYSVTGSVSGSLGGGVLPAATSNTQRFQSTDGSVAFNIVMGTTAAAGGNSIFMTVFKTAPTNPVTFAIVAGRTAFAATDRFNFDFVAPAPSYSMPVPMDLQFEYLGDADGNPGQVLTAANLPVYTGRQTLWERTALVGVATATAAASPPLTRYLFVNTIDPGLATNDYLVLEDGTANEEYARVSAVDSTLRRITLTFPLRYAHASGAAVQEATMVYRQEGAANYYTLNPNAGTITLNAAATAGNAFILSYRSAGRFGWKRRAGDTLQAWYFAPLAEYPGLDETWGDWRGKPLVDGTYTVALWGYRSVEFQSGSAGAYEWQTYRDTTAPGMRDFLFGATSTVVKPYSKIDNAANCNTCHDAISFHGGGRLTADTCLMCHATPGPAVNYRTLLHGIHAQTFPALPNGAGACAKCHGATNVFEPLNRSHPVQQARPAQDWSVACMGCHTSSSAGAHADTTVSPSTGVEACATCHGPDRALAVQQVHKAR